MKRLTAFWAITGLLLGEAAAEDRIERIDLTSFTCKQFLELSRDDALIVVGWLQGYYLDEHETPVVDFTKLSVESVSLANRCVARPDEKDGSRPRVRQVDFSPLPGCSTRQGSPGSVLAGVEPTTQEEPTARELWARKVDLLYIGDQFRASALHEEK
jgi:hypothetical protein